MTALDWQTKAVCRNGPVNRQFPHASDIDGVHAARRVCAACPVRADCLDYALRLARSGPVLGIWGGLTERERARYAAGQPATRCVGCNLPHVPVNPGTARCTRCGRFRANPVAAQHRQTVEDSRALVEAWRRLGHPHGWIANRLDVPRTTVTNAISRWRNEPAEADA